MYFLLFLKKWLLVTDWHMMDQGAASIENVLQDKSKRNSLAKFTGTTNGASNSDFQSVCV